MTNIYVGPEDIAKVVTSIYKVPLEHKFPSTDGLNVRADQRLFIAVRGKKISDLPVKLLDQLPMKFSNFGELYQVVYNSEVYSHIKDYGEKLSLEVFASLIGVTLVRYVPDKDIWARAPLQYFIKRELYKEDTQMSQIERLFTYLNPKRLLMHN